MRCLQEKEKFILMWSRIRLWPMGWVRGCGGSRNSKLIIFLSKPNKANLTAETPFFWQQGLLLYNWHLMPARRRPWVGESKAHSECYLPLPWPIQLHSVCSSWAVLSLHPFSVLEQGHHTMALSDASDLSHSCWLVRSRNAAILLCIYRQSPHAIAAPNICSLTGCFIFVPAKSAYSMGCCP